MSVADEGGSLHEPQRRERRWGKPALYPLSFRVKTEAAQLADTEKVPQAIAEVKVGKPSAFRCHSTTEAVRTSRH
jgi:hypothetical protein